MSDEEFDDDLGSDVNEDVLEDQEDSDDDHEPFGVQDDEYVVEDLIRSRVQAQRAIQSDRSAIEQIRVNKRLSGDQTLRRLLMKACQRGYKGVLDKLLELRVRTTGDFGNEVS